MDQPLQKKGTTVDPDIRFCASFSFLEPIRKAFNYTAKTADALDDLHLFIMKFLSFIR